MTADRMIRILAVLAVIGLAAVAAIVSYDHALTVALGHGQVGLTAHLTPLTIDALVLVAGLVLLDAARQGDGAPGLGYLTLALGIAATLAVNVLYGWSYGPVGAIVAGWPAVALVLSTELLMGMIRRGQRPAVAPVDTPAPVTVSTAHLEVSTPAESAVHQVAPDAPEVAPVDTPAAERLSAEDARRVIREGWTAGKSVRETAVAATRSPSYVQQQFRKLDDERAIPGQLIAA